MGYVILLWHPLSLHIIILHGRLIIPNTFAGTEKLREKMTMHVLWRMDCKWPKFLKGKKYYIIARDGIPYTDDAGNKRLVITQTCPCSVQWKNEFVLDEKW